MSLCRIEGNGAKGTKIQAWAQNSLLSINTLVYVHHFICWVFFCFFFLQGTIILFWQKVWRCFLCLIYWTQVITGNKSGWSYIRYLKRIEVQLKNEEFSCSPDYERHHNCDNVIESLSNGVEMSVCMDRSTPTKGLKNSSFILDNNIGETCVNHIKIEPWNFLLCLCCLKLWHSSNHWFCGHFLFISFDGTCTSEWLQEFLFQIIIQTNQV